MAKTIEEQIKDKCRKINDTINGLGPAGHSLKTSMQELHELINRWCDDQNVPRWPAWLRWIPDVQKRP